MRVNIFDAEDCVDGARVIRVAAGTEVNCGDGWVVTVSEAGLRCDCGKGVLCPSNYKRRVL